MIPPEPGNRSTSSSSGRQPSRSCALERLRDAMRKRDVFVKASRRWRDPREQLLAGDEWDAARSGVCRSLGRSADGACTARALAARPDPPVGPPGDRQRSGSPPGDPARPQRWRPPSRRRRWSRPRARQPATTSDPAAGRAAASAVAVPGAHWYGEHAPPAGGPAALGGDRASQVAHPDSSPQALSQAPGRPNAATGSCPRAFERAEGARSWLSATRWPAEYAETERPRPR